MDFTNNYSFPIYEDHDRPNLQHGYNWAMDLIDHQFWNTEELIRLGDTEQMEHTNMVQAGLKQEIAEVYDELSDADASLRNDLQAEVEERIEQDAECLERADAASSAADDALQAANSATAKANSVAASLENYPTKSEMTFSNAMWDRCTFEEYMNELVNDALVGATDEGQPGDVWRDKMGNSSVMYEVKQLKSKVATETTERTAADEDLLQDTAYALLGIENASSIQGTWEDQTGSNNVKQYIDNKVADTLSQDEVNTVINKVLLNIDGVGGNSDPWQNWKNTTSQYSVLQSINAAAFPPKQNFTSTSPFIDFGNQVLTYWNFLYHEFALSYTGVSKGSVYTYKATLTPHNVDVVGMCICTNSNTSNPKFVPVTANVTVWGKDDLSDPNKWAYRYCVAGGNAITAWLTPKSVVCHYDKNTYPVDCAFTLETGTATTDVAVGAADLQVQFAYMGADRNAKGAYNGTWPYLTYFTSIRGGSPKYGIGGYFFSTDTHYVTANVTRTTGMSAGDTIDSSTIMGQLQWHWVTD